MIRRSQAGILVFGLAFVLLSSGCAKLKSRDEMNKGVQAYKNAKFPQAVNHFKEAVNLDPTSQNARLYLAMSYMTQWVPGADSPDNNKLAQASRDEFEKVLQTDPNDKTALASMASIAYNSASSGSPEEKAKYLAEAKKWNQRRIEVDPQEAEAYYSLGVIAWGEAYGPIQTARVNSKPPMRAEDPGPIKDAKVRAELKEKYGSTIDQGVQNLQKAIEIDKEYDDAMTYLNILLRKKADLADTPEEAQADTALADKWFNSAVETKKIKASRPAKKDGEKG